MSPASWVGWPTRPGGRWSVCRADRGAGPSRPRLLRCPGGHGVRRVDPRSPGGMDRPERALVAGRWPRAFPFWACASVASSWPRSSGAGSPGPSAPRSDGGPSGPPTPTDPRGTVVGLARGRVHRTPRGRGAGPTDVSLHAFVAGIHTGVQFHPEVTKEIVAHWVDNARARGHLEPGQADDLLVGFDAGGRDPRRRPPDCSRASSSGAASPADPVSHTPMCGGQ